jgi:hypothetical protein
VLKVTRTGMADNSKSPPPFASSAITKVKQAARAREQQRRSAASTVITPPSEAHKTKGTWNVSPTPSFAFAGDLPVSNSSSNNSNRSNSSSNSSGGDSSHSSDYKSFSSDVGDMQKYIADGLRDLEVGLDLHKVSDRNSSSSGGSSQQSSSSSSNASDYEYNRSPSPIDILPERSLSERLDAQKTDIALLASIKPLCSSTLDMYKTVIGPGLLTYEPPHNPPYAGGVPLSFSDQMDRLTTEYRTGLIHAIKVGWLDMNKRYLSETVSLQQLQDVLPADSSRSASNTLVVLGKFILGYKKNPNSAQISRYLREPKMDVALKVSFKPMISTSVKMNIPGASGTGKKPNQPVVMVDEMYYESLVYNKVVNRLLSHMNTPHLLACYAVFEMNNIMQDVYSVLQKGLPKKLNVVETAENKKQVQSYAMACGLQRTIDAIRKRDKGGYYDYNSARVLVLERARSYPLLRTNLLIWSDEKIGVMICQTLWTLHCMQQVGLRHNDLHENNIRVETRLVDHVIVYFITEDEYMAIPTQGIMVKLFDWDAASTFSPKSAMGPVMNRRLGPGLDNLCQRTGTCDMAPNPKSDTVMFLYHMYVRQRIGGLPTTEGIAMNWIKNVVMNYPLFTDSPGPENWPTPGVVCKLVPAPLPLPLGGKKTKVCDGNYVPPDTLFPSTLSILKDIASRMGWLKSLERDGIPKAYVESHRNAQSAEIYHSPNMDGRFLSLATLRLYSV